MKLSPISLEKLAWMHAFDRDIYLSFPTRPAADCHWICPVLHLLALFIQLRT
jgi:hypothetical protein